MTANVDYTDRDELDTAILDALIDRSEDGMTIFELRTHVEVDINELEAALQALHEDGLIVIDSAARGPNTTVIKPAPAVSPPPDDEPSETLFDKLRQWLGR